MTGGGTSIEVGMARVRLGPIKGKGNWSVAFPCLSPVPWMLGKPAWGVKDAHQVLRSYNQHDHPKHDDTDNAGYCYQFQMSARRRRKMASSVK